MNQTQLGGLLGKGDTFISQDLQSATLFGDYRVDGAVMNVGGYNDYLSRLTRRISQALSEPLPKGNKIATHLAKPYLQVNTADLTGWLDDYIWTRLFGAAFNPLEGENWRCCCCSRWWTTSPRCLRGAAGIRGAAHHRPDRSAPARC
jgi:type III restriction enzyme